MPRASAVFCKNTTDTCCRFSPFTKPTPATTCNSNTRNRHPSLIRRVLSSGVFAEGWAVYTEQMMLDQGYGDGDLALRLNQLKFYLRAVANAILDQRMHTMDDRRRGDETLDRRRVPIRRRSPLEGHSRETKLGAAFHLLRRPHGLLPSPPTKPNAGSAPSSTSEQYHEAVLSHGTLPVKFLPASIGEGLR